MANDYCDVLIIGAGAAGVAAASVLKDRGIDYQLLEAREQIGGRLRTIQCDDIQFPIELGAEFVHGKCPELWAGAAEHGIRWAQTNGLSFDVTSSGLVTETAQFQKQMARLMDALVSSDYRSEDDTFAGFTDLLQEERPEFAELISDAEIFIEDYTAADIKLISVDFLRRGELAVRQSGQAPYRVIDGYVNCIRQLYQSGTASEQLRLNTVVKKVDWSEGKVVAHATTNGDSLKIECRRLLVTVPVSVLQLDLSEEGALEFCPALTQKKKTASKFKMGTALKVVAVFSARFWEDLEDEEGNPLDFGFINCSQAPIPLWWTLSPLLAPVLVGWKAGPEGLAEKLNGLSLESAVIESLSKTFGKQKEFISSVLKKILIHDWNKDPFSRGVYSFQLAGTENPARDLAEPIADTLFFAGEATDAEGCSGTVHGAIRSGIRAAREIIATL